MNIDCAPAFSTGNGSLSNKNSSQLLQRTLTSLSKNNIIKMRSLSLSGMYDQPLLSIDPANSFIPYNISANGNDSSSNPTHHEFIEFNGRSGKRNSYPRNFIGSTTTTSGNTTTSSKSRVPDILMINKYYGLVPQKFTISSRKPTAVSSTPSSASGSSRRAAKSNSAKPRAKSSSLQHHYQRQEERRAKEGKGHRSENDSPEPTIKMVLVTRRGSSADCESRNDKSTDPFGPVTKRMSVEKYKKWRNNGGGHKGINLNMEGSIGQTLSLLENGLKSHARRNGGMDSADCITNRRVIKIDLNSASWDEENYEVSPSPGESTMGENLEIKTTDESDVSSPIFNGDRNSAKCSRQESSSSMGSSSSFDDNGCFMYWANNDNKLESPLPIHTEQSRLSFSSQSGKDEHLPEKGERMGLMQTSSTEAASLSKMDTLGKTEEVSPSSHYAKIDASSEDKDWKGKQGTVIDSALENAPKAMHDPKVTTMKGSGKLSQRTISFDEKLLEGTGTGAQDGSDKSDNCSAKRRPMTASARCSTNKTFNTPNSFNPPSKVIPWTQQKSAGGKPLTLAERRAKLQRVPSVHSSSSLSTSMEAGDEEALSEEVDSNSNSNVSTNCIRPPSSAFKDSRKPLYVMQPPEVPTMISQINPNADEDIQIEIEKVALMLRKMQSLKQFSRSLDSGIEADMLSRSQSVPEGSSLCTNANVQSVPNNDKVLLPKSEETRTENVIQNENSPNPSGSESSVSSVESNSSDEDQSQIGNKLKSSFPAESTTNSTRIRENDGNLIKRGEPTPARDGPINRQCTSTNNRGNISTNSYSPSSNAGSGTTTTNSNTIRKTTSSSISTSPQPSTPIPTKTTGQRPPLRKAISISCEKELLKAGADSRQNGVNSNANDHGKGGRPKTAVGAGPASSQRGYGTGTRSTHNNNYGHQQHRQGSVSSSSSSFESHHAPSPSGSQGSRNRKILIKKALMEINQPSVNLRRKWGTLGRPRTAPTSEKNNAGTVSQQQHPSNAQQKRKPLKASPIAISGDGRMGFNSSGKASSSGAGKSWQSEMENGHSEKGDSIAGSNQMRASSESREETSDKPEQQGSGDRSSSTTAGGKGRSAFRQCFSLDEGALLGFSIKSVNEGRIPIFERLEESTAASESGSTNNILNDEVSFLSSKKREQCLKVYEKMMKTGCAIKLDTIFRGMLTPSEYRAFMKAAEKATLEAEEKAREAEELALEHDPSLEEAGEIGG